MLRSFFGRNIRALAPITPAMKARMSLVLAVLGVNACWSVPATAPEEPDAAPAIDAALPDAALPDAHEIDADPSGPLSLIALGVFEAPAVGARVFSHAADGSWLESSFTDVDGRATLRVPPGGAVTIATQSSDPSTLTTILGVAPGDSLTFLYEEAEVPLQGPKVGEVTINLPAYAGAGSYSVGHNCGENLGAAAAVPNTSSLFQRCRGAGDINVVASAIRTSPEQANLAFAAGSGPLIDGLATINLTTWHAAASADITLQNVPPSSTIELGGQVVLGSATVDLYCTQPSGSVFRCPVPSNPTAGMGLRASVYVNGPGKSDRHMTKGFAFPVTAPAIDLAGLAPLITSPFLDIPEAGRPRVRWSSSGSLDAMAGGFVMLSWTDANGDHSWTFIMPPGLEIHAPAFPPGVIDDWLPSVQAADIEIELIELHQTDGNLTYPEYRQQWTTLLGGPAITRSTRID